MAHGMTAYTCADTDRSHVFDDELGEQHEYQASQPRVL